MKKCTNYTCTKRQNCYNSITNFNVMKVKIVFTNNEQNCKDFIDLKVGLFNEL